jgi:eukaryotic-like serine/threonine-protein kinase
MLRSMLAGVLAAGSVATALAAAPVMFRADPAHLGVYPGAGVPVLHGVKWKFRTGGAIVSTPAVSGGTVYFGSNDHNFYALEASSGRQLWKFATKARITSSPAVVDGRVFFGSYDGNFYALDAASGKPLWQFASEGERRFAGRHLHGALPAAEVVPDPFDVFLSSPTVVEGRVFFGSGDGNVYALDARSGALQWKFHTGNVVHASPAVAGGLLYVGSWDSWFYALDARSGAQVWRFKTGEDPNINNQVGIQSSALVADGTVYFGCRDSHLYALDARTGTKRWAFDTDGNWVVSSPVLAQGVLYFATSDSAELHAVQARDGAPLYQLSFAHWPFFSSPALAGQRLYIGSHAGKVLAFDLGTHQLAWTFLTDGAQQNLAALTQSDGTPNYHAAVADAFYDNLVTGVQRMMTVGAVLSSPVVDGDTLYFGSWDGQLYALG